MRRVPSLAIALACGFAPVRAQPGPTAILDRINVTEQKPIEFHAAALPETVYVGQQATYQVAVLLSEAARARLRRNPEFLPPELRGVLAYELGSPTRVAPRSYGSAAYEAHVFQRAFFPVAAGSLDIPGPQLTYVLPQTSSYFSREERFVVRAESAQLVVRTLPADGRPSGFSGAVGVLRATTRLDPSLARVGDPLVITLRVEGIGNVKLLPRPALELSWASVVAGSERVEVDTTGPLVRGRKDFDWLLTPQQAGRVTIPAIAYAYFDPYRGEYAVTESSPMDIEVRTGTLATVTDGEASEMLALRSWQQRAVPTLRTQVKSWRWALLTLWVGAPLLLLATGRGWRRRGRVSAADAARTASREEAVPIGDAADDARRLRRVLLASLAERLAVSPQALVARRDAERVLRRRGVTRATTAELLSFLDVLAVRGFAAQGASLRPEATAVNGERAAATTRAGATSPSTTATMLLDRVNSEAVSDGNALPARHREADSRVIVGLLVVLSLGGIPMAMLSQPTESMAVQSAVDAYKTRQLLGAVEQFAVLVERHPQDVDLLANLGTAAWAAGDTVQAVIAWQRASRLDPLAGDLQERLALLPANARSGVAAVPMVPVGGLMIAATVVWVLGWLVVAWLRIPRTTPGPQGDIRAWRTVAVLAMLGACGMLYGAWDGYGQLDASTLAVVARPETMRVAPGTDANAMGGVATGDVVRIDERRSDWRRVRHADGRAGWVPAGRLVPLLDRFAAE